MDRYPDCAQYRKGLDAAAYANMERMTCTGCPDYAPGPIVIDSPQSDAFFNVLSQCSHMDPNDLLP